MLESLQKPHLLARRRDLTSPQSPARKKSSSKTTSDNLKSLDEKWSQRFATLEAMLLAKSFAIPVEPVKKPTAVVTSPFLIQELVPA